MSSRRPIVPNSKTASTAQINRLAEPIRKIDGVATNSHPAGDERLRYWYQRWTHRCHRRQFREIADLELHRRLRSQAVSHGTNSIVGASDALRLAPDDCLKV